jgi:hypothetical protein
MSRFACLYNIGFDLDVNNGKSKPKTGMKKLVTSHVRRSERNYLTNVDLCDLAKFRLRIIRLYVPLFMFTAPTDFVFQWLEIRLEATVTLTSLHGATGSCSTIVDIYFKLEMGPY